MRLGDELAVIAAGPEPRVVCGLTDHQRSLREALDSISPGDGPTRVVEAVGLARRLLSGTEKVRRAVVLTDGCFDGAAALAGSDDVELIALGQRTGNAGITRLQARRSLLDPIGYEILVEVINAADEAASFRLELDLEEEPIDVVPLTLQPGEHHVEVFEKTSAEGGRLRAHIDRADALSADNTAWAILPRRSRQKVVLVTRGNLFLEKVFEAIPLVDLEVLKPKEGEPVPIPSLAASLAGNPNTPVLVYHRLVPDAVPAGNVLVIEPGRAGPLWELGEALHNPVVARQDKESPLMAHIRLDNVLMPEARKLTLKGAARVLAESAAGDPLYAVLDQPAGSASGRVVVLTVDLDKSDLPLQTAFPIMMTNLLSWFGGTKGELRESLPAGAIAEVELPVEKDKGIEHILRSPDGREQTIMVPVGSTRTAIGPLDRTGIWSVIRRSDRGGPVQDNLEKKGIDPRGVVMELPCNLADRRESDLRPDSGLPERRTSLAAGWAVRPIWYYLLASAFLLTCWEWFLYQRRWID
jgi:hypothetical protein